MNLDSYTDDEMNAVIANLQKSLDEVRAAIYDEIGPFLSRVLDGMAWFLVRVDRPMERS